MVSIKLEYKILPHSACLKLFFSQPIICICIIKYLPWIDTIYGTIDWTQGDKQSFVIRSGNIEQLNVELSLKIVHMLQIAQHGTDDRDTINSMTLGKN